VKFQKKGSKLKGKKKTSASGGAGGEGARMASEDQNERKRMEEELTTPRTPKEENGIVFQFSPRGYQKREEGVSWGPSEKKKKERKGTKER